METTNILFTTDIPNYTPTIPSTTPTPISTSSMELGPSTGDDIGDGGLTWTQRACKSVYDTKECNDSENGFSPADVACKLNGRVPIVGVMEATDFQMM